MKTKKKGKRSWKNEKNSSTSSSDSEANLEKNDEHDLTVYAGNSIKLMTEIFKILGDKKLKKMTPAILKPIDMNDLKACLVEESMALSKKRVVSILNGETYTSTSSESEDEVLEQGSKSKKEKKDPDVISLDCISDDSDICCFDDLPEVEVLTEIKQEDFDDKKDKKKNKKQKKHKRTAEIKKTGEKPLSVAEEKAMTALELLELQARARAIKSQLALESVTSPIDNVDEEIKNELKQELSNKEIDQSIIKEPVTIQTKTPVKKVKLRRDHLRIDPNRTTTNINRNKVPEEPKVASINDMNPETSVEKITEIKKERRSSSESIILESPSHPLIVISSEDEDGNKKKSSNHKKIVEEDSTKFTETEANLVEQNLCESPTEISSQEEGEIYSDQEIKDNLDEKGKGKEKNNSYKSIEAKSSKDTKEIKDLKSTKESDRKIGNKQTIVEQTKTGNKKSVAEQEIDKENEEIANDTSKEDTESVEVDKEENEKVDEPDSEIIQNETNTSDDKNTNLDETSETANCTKTKDSDNKLKSTMNSETNEKEEKSESLVQDDSATPKRESIDQDCIVIDSEPEFDSEPDDNNSKDKEKTMYDETSATTEHDNATWKARWLDSKKVKSVLQTSKLCNNMKRKISLKKDQEKTQSPTPTNDNEKQLEKNDENSKGDEKEEGTVEQFNSISNM